MKMKNIPFEITPDQKITLCEYYGYDPEFLSDWEVSELLDRLIDSIR